MSRRAPPAPPRKNKTRGSAALQASDRRGTADLEGNDPATIGNFSFPTSLPAVPRFSNARKQFPSKPHLSSLAGGVDELRRTLPSAVESGRCLVAPPASWTESASSSARSAPAPATRKKAPPAAPKRTKKDPPAAPARKKKKKAPPVKARQPKRSEAERSGAAINKEKAAVKVEIAAAVEAMEFQRCVELKATLKALDAELAATQAAGGAASSDETDSDSGTESESSSAAFDAERVEAARAEIRLDMDDAVIELDFDRAAAMRNLLADLNAAADGANSARSGAARQTHLDAISAITDVWSQPHDG